MGRGDVRGAGGLAGPCTALNRIAMPIPLRPVVTTLLTAILFAVTVGPAAPPMLIAQSVALDGPNRPIPNARREPATPMPSLEPLDSLTLLVVSIDTAGRPRMETLHLSGKLSERSRARLTAWVLEGTYRLSPVDGKVVESLFIANPRFPTGLRGSSGGAEPGTTMELMRTSGPRMRPGDLSIGQMRALAGRVARIASDLDTLYIPRESTVRFDATLRIAAFDASGQFLGTLAFYDTRFTSTIALNGAQAITGRELGAASLRITWPAAAWDGQTREALSLEQPVVVTDDPGRVAATRLPTGSGGGSCPFTRLQCYLRTLDDFGRERREPPRRLIQLLVLSKYPADLNPGFVSLSPSGDTAEMRQRMRAMTEQRRAAEDRGRYFSGTMDARGRSIGIELSQMSDTVFVGDRHFVGSWRRDSAQVVLVDFSAGTTPQVQSLMIPSAYPDGVDDKRWTSGDTIFTVRVRDAEDRWRQFLSRYPAIAAFLR